MRKMGFSLDRDLNHEFEMFRTGQSELEAPTSLAKKQTQMEKQ
jgi:hypothetical protein